MATELIATSKSGDTIEVHANKIVIKRKTGLKTLMQGLKGQKEIPIRSITAVQFKPAGLLLSGYIQFTVLGGKESTGGWQSAATDENSIEFVRSEQPYFQQVKDAVDAKIEALSDALMPALPTLRARRPESAPCPNCQGPLLLDSLRPGDNCCPHCNGTFTCEA